MKMRTNSGVNKLKDKQFIEKKSERFKGSRYKAQEGYY